MIKLASTAVPTDTSAKHCVLRAQEKSQKRRRKDFKSQTIRQSNVEFYLQVISEVIHIKAHQYDCINVY